MKADHSPRQQPIVGQYALGMATGVLLAVLTSFIPVVAILGIAALAAATWFALARGRPHEQLASLGGTTIGSGLVLLYAAVSTVLSCSQTANFCGNANVVPLVALALGAVVTGLVASIALVRTRR